MALWIEPGQSTVEVGGESIPVLILNARDRMKLLMIGAEIAELVGDAEEVTPTTSAKIQTKHLEALELALPDGPDRVSTRHWPELVGAIFRVNQLSGEDSKN